jgi:hypothetical protein
MAKYVITYDLCKPGQNYDNLIAAIKKYSWAKVTESSWFIGTADSAATVRDNLLRYIDSGDRLMVAALTGEASWHNCLASTDDIKKLLTS